MDMNQPKEWDSRNPNVIQAGKPGFPPQKAYVKRGEKNPHGGRRSAAKSETPRTLKKGTPTPPKISNIPRSMADPIDLIGKRATSKVQKKQVPQPTPQPVLTGKFVPIGRSGRVSTDEGPKGPTGTRGSDTAWAQGDPKIGTHRQSYVSFNTQGTKGAKKMAKAQTDTTAMPKRIMSRDNQKTGAEVLRHRAGLKKDITSGFVPSIGVKQGKKRDLQSPAKNLYPPAGRKKG
jgi:hypothetical protein